MPTAKLTQAARKQSKKPSTSKGANRLSPAEGDEKHLRRVKPPMYRSFRLQKSIKHHVRLPGAWKLTKQAAQTLWGQKKVFIGITLIYGILNLVLVQGLASNTNVASLKSELSQIFSGHFASLASSATVFLLLIGSSGNGSSDVAGAYQLILALIASLALIWALRQVLAGTVIRVRDAFYQGMYPLVPFILVLCVIGLQLLPMIIGSSLYGLVVSNGIAVYPVEKIVWALFALVLALLSLYMLSSSIFALYIVTLPEMTPLKALRSARALVRYRRWTMLRKILFLPLVLFIVAAIIMLPIILFLTPLSQWIFFSLTMFTLTATHAYMYGLYRELLRE